MTILPILALLAVAAVTIIVFVLSSRAQGPGWNWPWERKSGLAKATAILATIFLVSIGLCGANFVAATSFPRFNGNGILMSTGWIELLCMGLSLLGLILVLFLWLGKVIRDLFKNRDGDQ
jgi:hypothetical protein